MDSVGDHGNENKSPARERVLLVTGRLAEFPLRQLVDSMADELPWECHVEVLGISVAALMHADWVARKLSLTEHFDRVILPGWCQGDLDRLEHQFQIPFQLGPKDLYDLPEFFGQKSRAPVELNAYRTEILAEINHAPRMTDHEILELAGHYRNSGANLIDLGCIPGETWPRAGDITRRLIAEGHRVSIDSFDRTEVEAAVDNGAELVLSCNRTNRDWVAELDAELVVIPDDARDLSTWNDTIAHLTDKQCRFRLDPILEPIGFGFAASLARFYETRRRFPGHAMMMGVGNLTELTEVDTAGMNVLLAAICEELAIESILTTEVINWASSAVREFDLARKLVHFAVTQRHLPKHVDSSLVMLRDAKIAHRGEEELARLAESLTDPNFRIFVERGEIHLMNRDGHWRGRDPFELFEEFSETSPVSSSHAFYLGYELAKAVTALTLGKQYTQDQALSWGFLTVPEKTVHERRRK